jgi:hypothetical protein
VVTKHGMNVILFHLKPADFIQHLLACRASINCIPEKVDAVDLLYPDDIFQQAAEGPGTAVNIRYDETTGVHINNL